MRDVFPQEIWIRILDDLSYRDASRCRLVCKSFNETVLRRKHIDLSECGSLLRARYSVAKALRKRPMQLTLPLVRFLEEFWYICHFQSIKLTGAGISVENMLPRIPEFSIHLFYSLLSHLTITNAAFVRRVSMPDSSCEDYFNFDVSALLFAPNLQSLHIHFDRIVQAVSRYDMNCGAWLSGLETCNARDVRIIVESPPFTSVLDDLPPYGIGGSLKDRMAFLVSIPSKVHHLYILTDCVLWLDNVRDVHPEIFNLCLLSVKRPSFQIPNTQIRRVYPNATANFQKPLICITSKSTPDHIYTDNLSRLAPGHCDFEQAEEIQHDSWDDE